MAIPSKPFRSVPRAVRSYANRYLGTGDKYQRQVREWQSWGDAELASAMTEANLKLMIRPHLTLNRKSSNPWVYWLPHWVLSYRFIALYWLLESSWHGSRVSTGTTNHLLLWARLPTPISICSVPSFPRWAALIFPQSWRFYYSTYWVLCSPP